MLPQKRESIEGPCTATIKHGKNQEMIWDKATVNLCKLTFPLHAQSPKILSLPLRVVEFFQFSFILPLRSPVINLNLVIVKANAKLGGAEF